MTDKTIADVLDKSIDKLSGGAAEVAKAVKQVAPHAWEVAVRQQAVEGWLSVVTGLMALLLCLGTLGACLRWRRPLFAWLNNSVAAPVVMFPAAGWVALIGVACSELRSGALQVANPEYYAAKAILEAVK